MNKFYQWIKNQDKKQRGVALKLGISTSTLHDILRNGLLPSITLAYKIEKYTRGEVTLYDWVDQPMQESNIANKMTSTSTVQNIST